MTRNGRTVQGFTLIELSIVLVIIGLIAGGVLVGQDLISAAAIRAQISEMEKYNSAVNTFKTKYNAIPGDVTAAQAAQFGFVARAGTQGRGDGNGLIEPWSYEENASSIQWPFDGEPLLFWTDLSTANLVSGNFNATDAEPPGGGGILLSPGAYPIPCVAQYVPTAKVCPNCSVLVYSYGGSNYYTIIGFTAVGGYAVDYNGHPTTLPGMSVMQAYNIDKKIDDGLPQTGNVTATYLGEVYNTPGTSPNANPDTSATCYNNSTNTYSTSITNGTGINCALSFQMQGAAR